MKKVLFAIALMVTSTMTMAQWKSLFNGKNLTGWKQLNGKAKYEVKNGTIVGTTVYGEPNSFLVTEKEYDNFVLEFEFKVDSTMNSGVQFRSLSKADFKNGRVHGYQFEIDPSARAWSGGIYDEAGRGWLYPVELNPSAKTAFKQGQWNRGKIECIGNSIRTWLNGIPVAHLIDDAISKGFIALQVHSINNKKDEGRQISWRNIRIKTTALKPEPLQGVFVRNTIPNNLSDAEKQYGIELLFDGKSSTGWRGAYKNTFPERGWAINDGMIEVLARGRGGDIVTEKEYSAFILQFEFKLTDGANSGVKYFVPERPDKPGSAVGLEYQILDDEKHPDAKMGRNGNRTLASLYDLIASDREPRARKKIGEWNFGMIKVFPDNRVEHWLNGWKVLSYTRGSQEFKNLIAISKYKDWENFGLAPQGRILLQDHNDHVSFRSLKIQELK